nr:hypothetical protein [Tanacetum cinerariifolium]GEW54641.1 hypothetical protein [Tanacetum cinerariifolium]
MRLEECAMWDLDKVTWEGRVEAMGTIPVCVYAQESWGEGTDVLAGKLGVNTPGCDEDSIELKELMVFMVSNLLKKMELEFLLYALVVNPTIYVSCIKQFWATATVTKVNDVVQLRALIDGKKVVVSEAIIRRDLHLDDADGCLSAKRTAWNEFSCSMASVVICLTTSRNINFSKYIFYSMVRNVDSPSKFLMYLLFLQVVLDNQVDDMTTHNTRYTSPAITQKVFANMKRVRKGFSSVETPLFASMLVKRQPQAEEGVDIPIAPTPPSTTTAPSPADLQDPTPTPYATPPQDQYLTPHDSPPQEQPTTPHDTPQESSIPLLTTLMETSIDADKGIPLVDVETAKEVVAIDAESHERLSPEEVNAASKGVSAVSAPELVSAVEPTVFDDEDVTMTMAQTLIKLKAKKAKLLNEQIAQKQLDEDI